MPRNHKRGFARSGANAVPRDFDASGAAYSASWAWTADEMRQMDARFCQQMQSAIAAGGGALCNLHQHGSGYEIPDIELSAGIKC